MADELTPRQEQELKEEQQELLQDSVENQREAVEQSSKFAVALENLGSDARKKLGDTVSSIKESATSTLKSIPDLATAGIQDPALRTLAQGAVGGAKALPGAARYTKGLFSGRNEQKPERKDQPSPQQERLQETTTKIVTSVSDQNPTLEAIRSNTTEMKHTLVELMSFMKGDSLDRLEIRREEQRRNEQILSSLQSIEGSGFGGIEGFDEGFFDQQQNGIRDFVDSISSTVLQAIGAFALFKNRILSAGAAIKGMTSRIGSFFRGTTGAASGAAQSARAARGGAAGVQTSRAAQGIRAGVTGGGATASGAVGGGAGAAAIKYPRLFKLANRIKGVPLLAPLVAGIQGIMVASNDEMPEQQKKEELAAIIGSTVSGIGGAKLGAVLGGLFGGGVGAIPGALAGGLGGVFLGDYVGRKLAGFLLERPTNETPPLPDTETAPETAPNTPRGSAGPLGGSSSSLVESSSSNVTSAQSTQNFETRSPDVIRSELEIAREKLMGRAANIEDRKEVESLERELKSSKLERERASTTTNNNVKISENDSYSSQEISQVTSRLMSTRSELIKQFNNAETSSEKKELKAKLTELPGISTISQLTRIQTRASNNDSDTVVAPMVSNVIERINSVSSTIERQQQQRTSESSASTIEWQQQQRTSESSASTSRLDRYSSEIDRATSTMTDRSRASQIESDVQRSDIERRSTKTRLDAQRISSLYVQNQKQNATSIFVTPRARSLEIDRVETDRRSATEQAAQRATNRALNGQQGSTNISTNVVNNSQGIIKNKPSAGSEPDNVSDTIMNSWAP